MTYHSDADRRPICRRTALKAFVGVGLASGLADCAPAPEVVTAPAPPSPADPPTPITTDVHEHPVEGDLLVFAFGDREGEVISPGDVPSGGPQIFAFPSETGARHDPVSRSRLEQVMLVRVDLSALGEETRSRSVDGIVAYSAVCTHTGCEVSDWSEDRQHFVCPCHESEFDPSDAARVVDGPAPRRLAALPLKLENGSLMVAGGFAGRVGFQRGA